MLIFPPLNIFPCRSHMQSATNIILLSMALCDLLTILIPGPWYVLWIIQYDHHDCSQVQCITVNYNAVQYITMQYSRLHYGTDQYNTVRYSTVQYSTVQYITVQYSTVQYSTVQYSTVQYKTVQHAQYNIIPVGVQLRNFLRWVRS